MTGNKGAMYDKMVKEKSDDELGVFDKYEETFEKIRSKVKDYGSNSIIDFGCGTGNLCGPLSEMMSVIGIDKNYEMIQECKRKFPKMNIIEGSFLDISNVDQRADIVVSSYVMHGLTEEEKQRAIANMLLLSNKKMVIIVDLMFENMKTRHACKEELLNNNKAELWNFIESKHYFIIEDLKKYIYKLNLKVTFEHAVNFTWIAEIYE